MGKGRRIFFASVMVAAVGTMAWLLLKPRIAEPVYQGKPLDYWLGAYVVSGSYKLKYSNEPKQPTLQETDEALRQMGTNAVPFLLRRLKVRDSEIKAALFKFLQKQHLIKISYTPTIEFWNGFHALTGMGPAASNAVPELVKMLEHDKSPFAQQAVPVILGRIGPAAKAAVPALIRASAHTNWAPRCNALFALGRIRAEPKIIVPVLINGLSDSNSMVRAEAVRALEAYGKDAKAAVPKLIELRRAEPPVPAGRGKTPSEGWCVGAAWIALQPPGSGFFSPDVRGLTEEALKVIDPEAAAKEGIK